MHFIPHVNEIVVIQNIHFELCVKTILVVGILCGAESCLTDFREEPWLVVIDKLICFVQKVIEFLKRNSIR